MGCVSSSASLAVAKCVTATSTGDSHHQLLHVPLNCSFPRDLSGVGRHLSRFSPPQKTLPQAHLALPHSNKAVTGSSSFDVSNNINNNNEGGLRLSGEETPVRW